MGNSCSCLLGKKQMKVEEPTVMFTLDKKNIRSFSLFQDVTDHDDQTEKDKALKPKSKVQLRSEQVLMVKDAELGSSLELRYGFQTKKGADYDDKEHPNQDDYILIPHLGEDDQQAFFGVFDGHGTNGELCSAFAAKKIPPFLTQSGFFKNDPVKAIKEAYLKTNLDLNKIHVSGIDASYSGTTAISCWLIGHKLVVANVGDSRAIVGRLDGHYANVSWDQTPRRLSEQDRVKHAGAQVATLAEMKAKFGWDARPDVDEVPRLWMANKKTPGCAFTRSIGDSVAETIGVISDPEVEVYTLNPKIDHFFVLASDGVWTVLNEKQVTSIIVENSEDALTSAKALINAAQTAWQVRGIPADDITVVVVFIQEHVEVSPEHIIIEEKRVGATRRAAIMAEETSHTHDDDSEDDGVTEKNDVSRAAIHAALQNCFLFSSIAPSERDIIIDAMRRVDVKSGTRVIEQGDAADNFYVVEQGVFDVFVRKASQPETLVHSYAGSGSFGELALMYGTPRNASVVAKTDGVLWALPRSRFRPLVIQSSARQAEERFSFLRSVPLLETLSDENVRTLSDVLTAERFPDRHLIVQQGTTGERFYIVVSGTVLVWQEAPDGKRKELIRLGRGEHFGERSLLTNEPRAANVSAENTVECLSLGRTDFTTMLGALQAVLDRDFTRMMLQSIPILSGLTQADILALLDVMQDHHYEAGDVIISEGEIGDRFYILTEGEVRCSTRRANPTGSTTNLLANGENELAKLAKGDFFGEQALLREEPRAATVRALVPTSCMSIGRSEFNLLLGSLQDILDRRLTANTLRTVPLLSALSSEDFQRLVPHFRTSWYEDAQYIIEQGAHGSEMFVVLEGEVEARLLEDDVEKCLATKHKGDFFGEMALLTDEPRVCSIVAKGKVKCASLHRSQLNTILGPLKELEEMRAKEKEAAPEDRTKTAKSGKGTKSDKEGKEGKEGRESKEGKVRVGAPTRSSLSVPLEGARQLMHIGPNDIRKVAILGKGTFGTVWLVEHKLTHRTFAMKVLQKQRVIKLKQTEHVRKEKELLHHVSHPFLLNMVGYFQDPGCLYLVLELVQGGELFSHLQRAGSFDDHTARFYAACVVLAFEYLHDRKIVYRDLKPENMLIGKDGYPKICDFGFAKPVVDRTWTLCGTPDYLPPEIIGTRGHSFPADWWALGVLIYEMLSGYPPFYADDPIATYQKIMAHGPRPAFKMRFSKTAQDLVTKLLMPNPAQRLGSLKNGVDDIKNHKWFAAMDWAKLARKEITPPFKPKVANDLDYSNFDHYSDDESPGRYNGHDFDDF